MGYLEVMLAAAAITFGVVLGGGLGLALVMRLLDRIA